MHGIGIIALLLIAGLFAGCGDRPQTQKDQQVAAKVNGDEITVHQIRFLASRMDASARADDAALDARLLTGLIEQRLLVQQAEAEKLERDPNVAQAIEAARREILANAYLESRFSAALRPTDQEIERYFREHPELFSERRVYRVQPIEIRTTPSTLNAIRTRMGENKTSRALVDWLKARRIPFHADAVQEMASDEMPLPMAAKLHQAKTSRRVVIEMPGEKNILSIWLIDGVRLKPIGQEEARPRIESFLANLKRRKAAEAEVARLKGLADIEYRGRYMQKRVQATTEPGLAIWPTLSGRAEAVSPGRTGEKR